MGYRYADHAVFYRVISFKKLPRLKKRIEMVIQMDHNMSKAKNMIKEYLGREHCFEFSLDDNFVNPIRLVVWVARIRLPVRF